MTTRWTQRTNIWSWWFTAEHQPVTTTTTTGFSSRSLTKQSQNNAYFKLVLNTGMCIDWFECLLCPWFKLLHSWWFLTCEILKQHWTTFCKYCFRITVKVCRNIRTWKRNSERNWKSSEFNNFENELKDVRQTFESSFCKFFKQV